MILRNKHQKNQEDNMHAMIDVVFLLLIYFLCTAQFGILEKDVSADLNQGIQQEQKDKEKDFDTQRIMVLAQQQGYQCNGVRYDNYEALKQHLSRLRQVIDARIIIDGHKSVVFQDIMKVMDLSTGLKFSQISFAGQS